MERPVQSYVIVNGVRWRSYAEGTSVANTNGRPISVGGFLFGTAEIAREAVNGWWGNSLPDSVREMWLKSIDDQEATQS